MDKNVCYLSFCVQVINFKCIIIIIQTYLNQMDLNQLTKIKDAGNQLFKTKKYDESIGKFKQCISLIQKRETKDYLLKDSQVSKLYVICLINAALAGISLKSIAKYDEAVNYCDKALSIDQKNIKALYRRGLARKEKAQIIQRQNGVKFEGLLGLYQKSKQDFEQLCLVDKNNDLATKNLTLLLKDIYRVTIGTGQQADLGSKSNLTSQAKIQQKGPYDHPQDKPKKKGGDMSKIMKQYKVEEVTGMVQQKVRSQYLTNELPPLRSELEKAIRALEKSDDSFIEFVYRMNEQYLNKVQPTFDTLSVLVNIIIKKGEGELAKRALQAIQKQKSFKLLWKSYIGKQKQLLKQKWKQLGLQQQVLANF